jgi:hypothetical protein
MLGTIAFLSGRQILPQFKLGHMVNQTSATQKGPPLNSKGPVALNRGQHRILGAVLGTVPNSL